VRDGAAPAADDERDLPTLQGTRREAFGDAVRQHHRHLAGLAYSMCGNAQQAEDAVAEAFARVWPKFRRGAVDDLVPYLRSAVINEVRGGWRRRILERREEQRHVVDWRDGESPHRNVEDRDALWPALRQLPAGQRVVVVMRFVEDMSEEETARVLDLRIGTVKSRAARGLEQLRRLVGSDEP
jgi:RNA polymerase sigma-70 factor (sigma-E family)